MLLPMRRATAATSKVAWADGASWSLQHCRAAASRQGWHDSIWYLQQVRPFVCAASSSQSLPGPCTTSSWLRPRSGHFGSLRALGASRVKPKPISKADLDAWAGDPTVLGHVYTRPATEPYDFSTLREFGCGASPPEGWMMRLETAAGLKSVPCPNQDAFSYTLLDSGWVFLVVCDGHGDHGEIISERVARTIPLFLSQHVSSGVESALTEAFHRGQADLERSFKVEQQFSGTTVTACCIHTKTAEVWIAHAGDSPVVIGDLQTGASLFYTEDHKAYHPEEAERLQKCGAKVITKTYEDGDILSRVFIPRAGIPGLAMSRSLGDGCLKKYGVIATPEVRNVTDLWSSCNAPVALLGSDGLFDFIRPEAATSVMSARIRGGQDLKIGMLKLIRQAQHLWIEAEENYCDDITVMLLGQPSAQVSER